MPAGRAHPEGEALAGLEDAGLAEVDRVEDAEHLADRLALWGRRAGGRAAVAEPVHGARPAGQRRDCRVGEDLPDVGELWLDVGHAEEVRRDVLGRPAGGEGRADGVEVGVELGHGRGRAALGEAGGGHPDELGRDGHLGHVLVLLGRGQRRAVPGGGRQARLDQGSVHPDQQGRVAGRVRLTGHRVDAADPLVDLPHPVRRGARRGAVAVGGGQHVGRGGGEPAGRVVAPLAVLVDAGHGQRVQRLEQQRPEPGDGHGQVGVQPPRDAAGPEVAVVGRVGGHARGERRGRALEQPGPREYLSRHRDDLPLSDGSRPGRHDSHNHKATLRDRSPHIVLARSSGS